MEDDPLFGPKLIDMKPRKSRRGLYIIIAVVAAVLLFGSRLLDIYIDALWFSSVGYADVYWYKFRLGALLFVVFFALSFLIVWFAFVLLNKAFPELTERPHLRVASVEDIKEINLLPWVFRPAIWVISTAVALMSAVGMSQEWAQFALYLHAQPAGTADPVFNNDIGFYLFKLPAIELVSGWFQTVSVILFIAVAVASAYVWYLERVRGPVSAYTRRRATRAVSAAGILLALAFALSTYLDRFDLLHGQHRLFTGIDYTDANVRLTAMNVLIVLFVLGAIVLALNLFVLKQLRVIGWLAGSVAVVWLLGLAVIPQLVSSFSVKPNELAKEAPFIDHNIKMTRQAFAIDRFEERAFQPSQTLSVEKLQKNRETLENVRLWDRGALRAILSQIQEIRTYYDFRPPDVDRYKVNGKLKQVMLTTRELNTEQLPEQSRNWINQHVVYTHGYGVTMNSVNEFTPEGQPHLLLKNMPVESEVSELKVTRPEIYFGEETNSHVYVRTQPQGATQPEFNYPAADNQDSYTTYEGKAGIEVGGLMRKLGLSIYLGDGTNLLFSDYIKSESRLLMRRNVTERVHEIAPFLTLEDDPYIVLSREGKLYWMIDAYTTSDRYPYSAQYQAGGRSINYLRNSVKVVVDAYEGDVRFYVFDEPADPIIKVYQAIFPSLFLPASDMPADLREHVRYPSFMLNLQARVYTLYHMQNTQTFYNHEDVWEIAAAEGTVQGGTEPPPMQPYHVLMQLPGEDNSPLEFASVLPFTPAGPGRSNMIGWLAARSDGANYGHTLVYSFPKNVTINGPAQIRARVNQDPQLSGQITLWNQQGSELVRGNLLVIPIADSLLYVEAFYLQASGGTSKLPELRQVAIATQDRLSAAKSFDEALASLFPGFSLQGGGGRPGEQRPGEPPTQAQMASGQASRQPAGQGATGQTEAGQGAASQGAGQASPSTGAAPGAAGQAGSGDPETQRLSRQALQLISDYERLSAAGKHREAGEKLDQLKATLDQLNRKRGG
ncbi:MAG TPA: UPF0182 family protein [Blastocatellia bacterium]|nr:UPF0182 family protein [Blastocatellia bacterium]